MTEFVVLSNVPRVKQIFFAIVATEYELFGPFEILTKFVAIKSFSTLVNRDTSAERI